MPKVGSYHTCLSIVTVDSAFYKDVNYYLQVLKECKYNVKKWLDILLMFVPMILMKNRLKLNITTLFESVIFVQFWKVPNKYLSWLLIGMAVYWDGCWLLIRMTADSVSCFLIYVLLRYKYTFMVQVAVWSRN